MRNINALSKGDVARDTAAECAVYGGFGYYGIDIEYACDDTFDKDIRIRRIVNPLCIKPDPYSTRADSLDWNMAFEIDTMTPEAFSETYPKADPVSFDMMDDKVRNDWSDGQDIVVASYWKRRKAMKNVVQLSDGKVVDEAWLQEQNEDTGLTELEFLAAQGIMPRGSRQIETYVVDQCIVNGQEQLTEKVRWAGKYIPLIPVYGEEMHLKGKRMLWSMLHRARHAQEQFNYHETTATELYALSPRIPFIGPKGAFDSDPNWATANSQNHPYLEYDGQLAPQRQPLDSGPILGAMSLSKSAGDNLKAVLGMFDASLGNRSNETSGVALERRDKQADVGNFHFSDNVSRAIECEGTQLLDLIPKVYTKGRIARVLGEDGALQNVQLGSRQPGQAEQKDPNAAPPKIGSLNGVYDLTMGKYDLTVEAGPSYTTQRQETAAVVGELMRSNELVNAVGSDILVRNLDLKDGDELARRLKKMLPAQASDEGEVQIPPQVQMQLEQQQQMIAEMSEELNKLKKDEVGKIATVEKAKTDHEKNQVERARIGLEAQRLPIEDNQAKAALIQAEKDLLLARHQATQEANAAVDGQITPLADAILSSIQQLHVKASQPRVKRAKAKRGPNGEYELVSVEEVAQ
jgi:hypothetical protein